MSTTQSSTPVLQFGTSRFLQAHADLFLSEALAVGQAIGPVTVVQSSGDTGRKGRLHALAAPEGFIVQVQGLQDGCPVSYETRVTSIRRAMTTDQDWQSVRRIAVDEAEIILSNTGDQGWVPQPSDKADDFDQSMSYPAKLTHLLLARYWAGGRPIQVMPTELISRNGDRLRDLVLDLAVRLDARFAAWVKADVRFVNSLVDRIVSAPLQPAGAVAEPYALWAIEDCAGLIVPCIHPAVQVVQDLRHLEMLKLYILNLGHTWLVSDWQLRGRPETYVREMMAQPDIHARLKAIYDSEVLPGFAIHGFIDAPAYVQTTLDRFANPYLDHRLTDIAQNHAEKVRRRVTAFLDWSGSTAPRLRALSQLALSS